MRIPFQKACALLQAGDIVAIPTETVYGLAASVSHPDAVRNLFALKKRPADNPLIVHLVDAEHTSLYACQLPTGFSSLAATFWPGPMTLVLPAQTDRVPFDVRAGLETAAFRVPASPDTLRLLKKVGPLVMPSANRSGRPSSTCAEHVETDFGKDFPVLDRGKCSQGVESTILRFTQGKWVILRLGALPPEKFVTALGYQPEVFKYRAGDTPLSPGLAHRHYAPKAQLILDNTVPLESIGVVVGFSDRDYPKNCTFFSLGSAKDVESVAKNLFHTLRMLDTKGVKQAWVDFRFPREGLWKTIAERLLRAGAVSNSPKRSL